MAKNRKKVEHKFKIGEKVKYKNHDFFVIGKTQNGNRAMYIDITPDPEDFLHNNPKATSVLPRELKPYKTYAVDVHWDVARSFEIEATSREEAVQEMNARIDKGQVCVWTDGFEATEDVECECNGEENESGDIEFD